MTHIQAVVYGRLNSRRAANLNFRKIRDTASETANYDGIYEPLRRAPGKISNLDIYLRAPTRDAQPGPSGQLCRDRLSSSGTHHHTERDERSSLKLFHAVSCHFFSSRKRIPTSDRKRCEGVAGTNAHFMLMLRVCCSKRSTAVARYRWQLNAFRGGLIAARRRDESWGIGTRLT